VIANVRLQRIVARSHEEDHSPAQHIWIIAELA